MIKSWHSHKHWTEEAHKDFYTHFKQAGAEEQSKALLHQAELLSQSKDDTDLKYGESLLIQWMSIFRGTAQKKKAYSILSDIYSSLGQKEKAIYYDELITKLKPA